jgi:hypothetical protein
MSEVDLGAHTIWWRGLGGRHPMVWPLPGPAPALLQTSSRVRKNRRFRLCFIQFREYFMYNFSETQKTAENRELTLWHLVNRLVPENA